jgi:hypothetical protein
MIGGRGNWAAKKGKGKGRETKRKEAGIEKSR